MIKNKKTKLNKKIGCGIYDKSVNYLLKPEIKLKDGEKHAIMYNNGKFIPANYSGPGTDIITRLKKNIKPINDIDKTAQAHDIRYSLSKNTNDIKNADNKMVNKIKDLRKNNKENLFNSLPSQLGIQANQVLEKILPDKYYDKFVNYMTGYKDFNKNLKEDDKLLLENKLKELENEGFGKYKKKRKYNKKK